MRTLRKAWLPDGCSFGVVIGDGAGEALLQTAATGAVVENAPQAVDVGCAKHLAHRLQIMSVPTSGGFRGGQGGPGGGEWFRPGGGIFWPVGQKFWARGEMKTYFRHWCQQATFFLILRHFSPTGAQFSTFC